MSPGVQGLSVSKARSASIEVFGQHLWKLNLRHPTADHSQKTSPWGHSTDGKIESRGWTLAKATEQGRGQRDGLGSATDSHHLSCQALHHSVLLENEEKTQVRIALRNPDAFHKNKQGSFPPPWSMFLCVYLCLSLGL